MSMTISWCDVCNNGSLEGYPSMVYCRECGFSFHKHCAPENDEDEDENENEDENEDENEVSSSRCPRCQGLYIDPHSRGFADGYCQALTLAKVEILTYHLAMPLLTLDSHAGIVLNLPKIKRIDEIAITGIAPDSVNFLTSKYRLALQIADERLSGITEILTCEDVIQSIRCYLSGRSNNIDISGKFLTEKGALKPLLETIHRLRLGVGMDLCALEKDRRFVIDYVSEDTIASENNCEAGDELIYANDHDLNIEAIMDSPIDYFTGLFNKEGKLWFTFRKESGDEYSFEVTEDDFEFPEIKHDVVINDENVDAILQIATKLQTSSWNRKLSYPHSVNQPHLTSLSKAVAESLSKHQGNLYLGGLTEISDAVAKALSKHQGHLNLGGLTEISDAVAEALSKHQDLSLGGLTEITDAAVLALSKQQGDLSLGGLTEITDAVAEALSKHQGYLNLDGLTEITDAVALALSKHQGDLSLGGLTEITDAVAEALSKHKGDLTLFRLTELSDAAAKALSNKEGTFDGHQDPAEWVESLRA